MLPITLTLDSDYIRKQRDPVGFCRISGFLLKVDEKCLLLSHYAASNGNSLWTFRDEPSAPSSRFKNPVKKWDPIGCPETSVRY